MSRPYSKSGTGLDSTSFEHDRRPETPPPPYNIEGTIPHSTSASHDPELAELDAGTPYQVRDDGRVDIDLDSRIARTISLLFPAPTSELKVADKPPSYTPAKDSKLPIPPFNVKLNIVIQVVGSRGDVQPFLALGNELQRYGHRVRVATHDVFADFVQKAGLEFYPVGGNPAALMAYMVKNPSLMPSLQTIMDGEIGRKRTMVADMLDGFWDSCLQPDPVFDLPFVADAIIANPPSFAHVHCAEALGIPVHMMFTMPWSGTQDFPHPLANLANAGDDHGWANFMSYHLVEWMTWQGLGDVINHWRQSIQLEPINMADGPALMQMLKVPFTYCWSPSLVPKPSDWPENLDVCGFFFREKPNYTPPEDLDKFLNAGPPPVYLGFGSIVLDDPAKMLNMILEAVRIAGVRAIISKGWSDFGGEASDDVYYIGDCPHEWLFPRMAAVVHHGGAGTTACGIKNAIPTVIVPFFGDQPFWGHMVASAGVGPEPLLPRSLTPARLAGAIRSCLSDHVREAAQDIAGRMQHETGVQAAVESFHKNLDPAAMRCDVLPDQPAVWSCKAGKKRVKISKVAAEAIISQRPSFEKQLKFHQSKPFTIEITRWDPISGGASAVLSTAVDMGGCITGMVSKPISEYHEEKRRKARAEELRAFIDNRRQALSDTTSDKASIRTGCSSKYRRDASKHPSAGGKAAAAGAKSIGSIGPRALKGMTVDIPLAITEGLRSIPGYYGDRGHDNGKVTGIGSGVAVAGKSFAWGFIDGVSGLAVQPYKDVRKSGAKGLATGIGKGAVGLVTKSGAGMFGMFAYPASGIAKSLRSATHTRSKKAVEAARRDEGEWLLVCAGLNKEQMDSLAEVFDRLGST